MNKFSYSPFRYPGGKARLVDYVKLFVKQNGLEGGVYIEPFSGGASVALALLIEGVMERIVINDIDRSIYAAWYSILYRTEDIIDKIRTTPVTMEVWDEQFHIQKKKDQVELFDLGFSTFFLNRTNRSGILKGGCIGGREQNGNYKLDARFNKEDLIKRIKLIAQYKEYIKLFNLDVWDLMKRFRRISDKNLVYFDPPYFVKGKGLYVNFFEEKDHKILAERIKTANRFNWLVSYDNHVFIQDVYSGENHIIYELPYSAGETKSGSEIIFAKAGLTLPQVVNPLKLTQEELSMVFS